MFPVRSAVCTVWQGWHSNCATRAWKSEGWGGEGAGQQVGVHEVAANAYGLRQLKAQVEKVVQTEAECVCVRVCVR